MNITSMTILLATNNDYHDHIIPIKVASIDGLIIDREPHLHCVIGDKDRTYCGHILKGRKVLYLCEIVIQEILGLSVQRRPNEKGMKQIEQLLQIIYREDPGYL